MEIEELSKQQIVLLTMLVSFVTAIATGIVTVSLLKEAPTSVTRPVNHVVERTVERVVPQDQPTEKNVTKEKTVVVKQSQQMSEAITAGAESVVQIYDNTASARASTSTAEFLGIGVAIGTHTVVVDASILPDAGGVHGVLADDKQVTLTQTNTSAPAGFQFLTAGEDVNFSALPNAQSDTVSLGTQIIGVGYRADGLHTSSGIIAAVDKEPTSATTTDQSNTTNTNSTIRRIEISLRPDQVQAGMPIINMFGELIAVTQFHDTTPRFIPAEQIVNATASESGIASTTAVVND